MNPETRAFLDGVRQADDPTPEDERRVLGAVYSAVAAGTLLGGAVGASKATKVSAFFGITGVKLGGVLVGLGALAWTLAWVAPAPEPTTLRAPSPAPLAHGSSEPSPPASVSSPSPSALEEREKPPARRASGEPRRREPSPASLREEIALLADVKAALARGDGTTALRRLDGHVTTDRQLLAERRAARIFALCAVGRVDEARLAAREFLRNDPTSVQRAAVERSCAGTKPSDER